MPPDVLCKRRGNPLLRRGALLTLPANYVRGDYAFVSVRLQSQASFELRVYGVLRSCYRQATPSYSKKIAHLGYALLPYRLDTYDAMASLALTSHTSTKRRSIATLRHPAST